MNIYIDRTTGKASLSQTPLTYMVTVDDSFTLEKTIQVQEGEKQKKDTQGQLLYKMGIQEDGTYTETTEARTVTKTEKQEKTITTVDDDGKEVTKTVTVDVPIEWVDNDPVMVPSMVDKIVSISANPEKFTVEEIVNAKYKGMLEASDCDHILADLFLNEDDIDFTAEHKANTGVAIMELLPKGQAQTKPIKLAAAAKVFTLLELEASEGVDLYINDTKFTGNAAIFTDAISTGTIKFVNTTDKPKLVQAYAIGY